MNTSMAQPCVACPEVELSVARAEGARMCAAVDDAVPGRTRKGGVGTVVAGTAHAEAEEENSCVEEPKNSRKKFRQP